MTYLIDTNIISEFVRRRPNPGVRAWAGTVSAFALSAVSIEEIAYGLAWTPNQRIQAWFDDFLERHAEVFPVTREIAERAGKLRGALAAKGRVHSQADMLIAATALVHDMTLVTRNAKDFAGTGVPFLDPFT